MIIELMAMPKVILLLYQVHSIDIDIIVEGPSLSSKYDLHITYSLPLTAHIIHPKLGKHNNILHPNFVLSGNP